MILSGPAELQEKSLRLQTTSEIQLLSRFLQNILGGSLQSLIPPGDRLVKAKSDGSLASTSVSPAADSPLSKSHRSRSLEPLSGLATWSSEPQVIELVKGERGLGFSILDYQV